MPGSYTTWALRGAPSATHRRNVRVSGSKMTRCGRRNPCRSVRSESKELSEDWNPRCGPIPAAMRCRVSMYGTGFIKPADDCSDIRIKKGTGREAVSSPLCAIGCINAKRKTEQSALLIHKKGIRRIRGAFALMAHASERGKGALAPLYRKHASGPFQQTAKTAATRRGFRARARRP